MRPVAIAFAAFTVLATSAAVRPAAADQLFAQGGTAPAVGGNGQSGSPAVDTPDAAPATPPMHHRRMRHHRRHHTTSPSSMPPSSGSTGTTGSGEGTMPATPPASGATPPGAGK